MGKETEMHEGGPLMDPAGEAFQNMLLKAHTAAAEKLSVKPDTSMVEDEKDEKKPVSSTESKPEAGKEKEPPEPDADELEEDVDKLKHRITGLQAELARIRKQRTGSSEEASVLKERLADMEGQLKVLRENKTSQTVEDKLAKLTDDQVIEARVAWDDELSDARVAARLAERDRDNEEVAKANERITNARRMLKLYDSEKERRAETRATSKQSVAETRNAVATDMDTLFEAVYKAAPDLTNKDSELWKAGKTEYDSYPALMKQLGPLGELIAAAAAISKNPNLISKKATEKVIDDIEKAADKAFKKGGAAPSGTAVRPTITITSQKDVLDFEEQVRKVKGG